ncbi:MAG: hydrolase [Chloroflexi bacterium HGW-Chloroflexi-6]|nr:MAG: hydrolase [Chloroflexi bacterium HGW-Chloroflexi-6]
MLITNATIVTWGKQNEILADSALLIEDGKIADFGPSAELMARYPDAALFDARGQLLLPGNICAHTHFYGMYSRGLAIPGEPAAHFSQILDNLWWPLDQALDEEATRLSALVCLVDAIKHGTTTLIDHHASPNFLSGSLNAIGQEVEKAGLRSVLSYEVTDRYGEAKMRESIDENVNFIKATANGSRPLLRGTFGLHAPLTISTATLQACVQAIQGLGVGLHIHVSESKDDQLALAARGDGRPIEWLHRQGGLGPRSIVAHAVHVDDSEIKLLADSGTWVTHQPRSNMNNAVGVAQTEKMLEMGVKVCLGNDGFSNAMWEEWKAAYLLHKIAHEDPRRMGGYSVTHIAIYNNAALATSFYDLPIGIIEKGAAADLMLVDYDPPTPLTAGNLPWHILFGFRDSMITGTIVNGQVLMKDRQLLTLNEAKIAAQARKLAPKVWENYNKFVA